MVVAKQKIAGEETGIQVAIETPEYIQTVAELDDDVAKVKANYMKIGQLPPKANRNTPAPPNPIFTQPAPSPPSKGKLEELVSKVEEDMKVKMEPRVMTGVQKNVVRFVELPAAFDIGFKAGEQQTGSQQCTELKCCVVNVPAMKLMKQELKYLEWGVSSEWGQTHPNEQCTSRPRIDNCATAMPQGPKANEFIQQNKSNPHEYLTGTAEVPELIPPPRASAPLELELPTLFPLPLLPPPPNTIPGSSLNQSPNRTDNFSSPLELECKPEPALAATRSNKQSKKVREGARMRAKTKEKGRGRRKKRKNTSTLEVQTPANPPSPVPVPSQVSWNLPTKTTARAPIPTIPAAFVRLTVLATPRIPTVHVYSITFVETGFPA
ncbi:hypothetical protein FRC09_013588 [Ceratobasidium sp. 395]|nr:hypothetical protein FRC09_013588 [Ceratobasidium sp. 395]